MSRHHQRIARRRGFSLIELLVVIGIVAILAAILFPMLLRAKMKANEMKCLSNTSQIGKSMMMYANDYSTSLPCIFNAEGDWGTWTNTWRERLYYGKYLKAPKMLVCAVKNKNVDPRTVDEFFKMTGDKQMGAFSHYGVNMYLFLKPEFKVASPTQSMYNTVCFLGSIPLPTRTIMIAENNNGDWDCKPLTEDGSGTGSGGFVPYHGDKNNPAGVFIMADGHAKYAPVKFTEVTIDNVPFYYWKKIKVP